MQSGLQAARTLPALKRAKRRISHPAAAEDLFAGQGDVVVLACANLFENKPRSAPASLSCQVGELPHSATVGNGPPQLRDPGLSAQQDLQAACGNVIDGDFRSGLDSPIQSKKRGSRG